MPAISHLIQLLSMQQDHSAAQNLTSHFQFQIFWNKSWFISKLQLSFWISPISESRAPHLHCLQVYRSGLEAIFSKVVRTFIFSQLDISLFIWIYQFINRLFTSWPFQPKPESLLTPDGVCEDGEGWGCIGEIASKNIVMIMIIIYIHFIIIIIIERAADCSFPYFPPPYHWH